VDDIILLEPRLRARLNLVLYYLRVRWTLSALCASSRDGP
jgi:hypothetical protein